MLLVLDEIKIKEDIVFDKHSCSVLGFVNLGEFNNSLSQFEHECKGENEAVHERVATHILAFMVRGIFSSLKFPYAHFPTKGASADTIFPLIWEAVMNLEDCGLR